MFGFGLRAPWQSPRLALKGAGRHYLLKANPPRRDYRAEDSTLLYFDVPTNALPGSYDVFVHIDGGIWIGNRSGRDMTKPRTNRVALSHTIVADNVISHTPRGLSVSDSARKTFLLRNEFEQVDTPILDWGRDTVQQGNVIRMLDQDGERTVAVLKPAIKANAKGVSP